MTYLDHFSLAIPPFASTPDPSFFFPSHNYSNIVASLEFAIRRDFGIVKLVGEDGTGKTTLSRLLQDNLARDHATVAMLDARASGRILAALCECFGLQAEADPFESLKRFLLSQNHFGRLTVAIIDEAHHLEPEDFKALVRLERLDVEKKKLLQIVLLGHSQLDERLEMPDSGELARYIVFSLATQPLNDEECRRYLLHRLRLARPPVETEAEEFPPVFSDAALEQLARWSGGVPHVLNLLAESALQKAFVEGVKLVQSAHVLKAARAYPALVAGRPSRLALLRTGRKFFLFLALIVALVSAVATLVELREHRLSSEPPPPPVPVEQPKVDVPKPEPVKPEPPKPEPPKVQAPPPVPAPALAPAPAPKPEPVQVVAPPAPPVVAPVAVPQPQPEQKPVRPRPVKPVKPKPVKVAPAVPQPVPEEAPAPSNPGQISPDDAAPPPLVAAPKPDVDLNDALKAGSGVYPGHRR